MKLLLIIGVVTITVRIMSNQNMNIIMYIITLHNIYIYLPIYGYYSNVLVVLAMNPAGCARPSAPSAPSAPP